MFNIRFIVFLVVLFAAAFFWSGGNNILQAPVSKITLNTENSTSITGTWDRIYRIIALKNAVETKIDRKRFTKLQDIPLSMQQAIIAVEDHRFYKHIGFDIEGILRATLVNMQTSSFAEGGSTITQQLIKNLFLTQDKTFLRKLEEVVLAVDMELRYSKEEILEMYLNTIYFGSGNYGIRDACKSYFGKKPSELTLAESALLAGIPKAPSLYSPYVDYSAARQRQAVVLTSMSRNGYIGSSMAQEARTAPLMLAK